MIELSERAGLVLLAVLADSATGSGGAFLPSRYAEMIRRSTIETVDALEELLRAGAIALCPRSVAVQATPKGIDWLREHARQYLNLSDAPVAPAEFAEFLLIHRLCLRD